MFKLVVSLAALAATCSGTPITRAQQFAGLEDLKYAKVTLTWDDKSYRCYLVDCEFMDFAFSFRGLHPNVSQLEFKNLRAGHRLTGVEIDGRTFFTNRYLQWGRVLFDDWAGGQKGGLGGGVGHLVQGNYLGYSFFDPRGDNLYGGLTLTSNIGYGGTLRVRTDLDREAVTPEPGTMLLMGGGLALVGLWRRK